jgi:hypothetical protein
MAVAFGAFLAATAVRGGREGIAVQRLALASDPKTLERPFLDQPHFHSGLLALV